MRSKTLTTLGIAATMALSAAAAPAVMAQTDRQKDKNNMRNLGSGLGGAAVIEALRGNHTNALILGAGAAYSAKKYEDARKAQRKENSQRAMSGRQYASNIDVYVNDEEVQFNRSQPEVHAGNVYVPLRGVLEQMGAHVEWDAQSRRIVAHHNGKEVILPVNGQALVNGRPTTLSAPAFIANGRTMIPLRFMAETFGANVSWDSADKEVRIQTASR